MEEFYNPSRTRLSLDFRPKQVKKTSEESKRRRTEANYIAIRKYLKEHGLSKTNDIAAAIELSPARTRVLLKEMSDVSLLRQADEPDQRTDLGRQQIFAVI